MATEKTIIKTYKLGIINSLEAESIPRGSASDSLNWTTEGDHVELRRGQRYLGDVSVNTGNGKATGIKKITDALSVELLFGTYGKKLKYFNRTTTEWVENGSDLLGSAVVDSNGIGREPISMSEYVSPAGNQMFLNSPNCTGYFKIMVANPGSSRNMYDSTKNFKGHIKIDTNRTLLHGPKADKTGVYGSYIDNQAYTTVTAEAVGTGDGVTKTFIGSAAALATSPRTGLAFTFTDSTETFTDNLDGTLTGSLGGSGTINYVSGAYSITFTTAPANLQAITTTYQWENSNNKGITDFTKSATRLAGEGFIFRQDEGGGPVKAINQYNQVYYCMHLKKTWILDIGQTDTSATNLPYRQKVGIPNLRASVETGDGIYYIDDQDKDDVKARLLTYDRSGSTQVLPVAISNNLDLSDYNFDECAATAFGDLILYACALKNSTTTIDGIEVPVNNRTLMYNKKWKAWDILDYAVTCWDFYDGALVGGHSITNNFIEFFSGEDDLDSESAISNYWIGNLDDLDIEGLKKTRQFFIRGLIARDQKLKVSLSIDGGPFVEIGHTDVGSVHTYAIEGTGDYVSASSVSLGAQILGKHILGGGSGSKRTGLPFERQFRISTGEFEYIKVKYEAMAIGPVSVSQQKYVDNRRKGRTKVPQANRG